MRITPFTLGLIGAIAAATVTAQAQTAATDQTQTARPRPGNARESDAPPTLEQMQRVGREIIPAVAKTPA